MPLPQVRPECSCTTRQRDALCAYHGEVKARITAALRTLAPDTAPAPGFHSCRDAILEAMVEVLGRDGYGDTTESLCDRLREMYPDDEPVTEPHPDDVAADARAAAAEERRLAEIDFEPVDPERWDGLS